MLSLLLGGILSNLLYVGARHHDVMKAKAAKELSSAAPTIEEAEAVAAKYSSKHFPISAKEIIEKRYRSEHPVQYATMGSGVSNVEVKYYRDGTPVYGSKTEQTKIPQGATTHPITTKQPSLKTQIIEQLGGRLGYKVTTDKDTISLIKGGQQVTSTYVGTVKGPEGFKVDSAHLLTMQKQRYQQQLKESQFYRQPELQVIEPPKTKISKLRRSLEEKELEALRENKLTLSKLYGAGSAILYPIRSKDALIRLAKSAGLGAAIGGGLTALGLLTGPIGPAVAMYAGGGYLTTKVQPIQEKFIEARQRGPVQYRELSADVLAQTGAAIGGGYLGSFAVAKTYTGYQAYKESQFLKKIEVKGTTQWDKEYVTSRKLTDWEQTLLKSKYISEGQKQAIIQRAGGTRQYLLDKGQTQLYPKEIRRVDLLRQQPLEIQKGYNSAKGISQYLGKYSQLPKQIEISYAYKKPVTETQYELFSPVTGKSYFKVRGYTSEITVPTTTPKFAKFKTSFGKMFASKKAAFDLGATIKPQTIYDYEGVWGAGKATQLDISGGGMEAAAFVSKPAVTLTMYQVGVPYLTFKEQAIPISTIKKKPKPKFVLLPQLKPISEQTFEPIQGTPLATTPSAFIEPAVRQKTTPIQKPDVITAPDLIIPVVPKIPRIDRPSTPPTPPTSLIIDKPDLKKGIKGFFKTMSAGPSQEGYDVYVKRKQLKKGKGSYKSRGYKKANTEPLTKAGAMVKGMELVDRYTNRSFHIRKSNSPAKKQYKDHLLDMLKHRFRYSKKNPKVFVEKAKFAISSREEKLGIPYEAMRLRKAGLLPKKAGKFVQRRAKKRQTNFLKASRHKRKKPKNLSWI